MTAMGPLLPHYKADEGCCCSSSLYDDDVVVVNGPLVVNDIPVEDEEIQEMKNQAANDTNPVLRRVLSDLRVTQKEYGHNHGKVAEAWNALGLVRIHMQRNAQQALHCHERALNIFKDNQMVTEIAITMNDVAHCYEQLSQPQLAYDTYEEALSLMKQQGLSEYHPIRMATSRALSRLTRG